MTQNSKRTISTSHHNTIVTGKKKSKISLKISYLCEVTDNNNLLLEISDERGQTKQKSRMHKLQ